MRLALILLGLMIGAPAIAAAPAAGRPAAAISVIDAVPFHVHPPDKPFVVTLRVQRSGGRVLSVVWQDYQGRSLTAPAKVRGDGEFVVRGPSAAGAYLQMTVRDGSSERVFGFARVAHAGARPKGTQSSQFGIVHGDPADPYSPAWNKTLTWKTLDPRGWGGRLRGIAEASGHELPLIVGYEWDSDDTRPIGGAQLKALQARAANYFAASPEVRYWELGLEENLTPRYRQRHYWPNLRAKVRAMRAAADGVDKSIRFVYQIATTTPADVRPFLESEAAAHFDVLSLHPYAWPDFRDPDLWLESFLQAVRADIDRTGKHMPIWFTEAGVPICGGKAVPRFTTADSRQPVSGLNRAQAVAYLLKLHTIALQNGVERIFWYHYQDRGATGDDPEDYFGLRDAAGFPKPAYVAHHLLRRHLDGKQPGRLLEPAPGARLYEFADVEARALVAWTTGDDVHIPIAAIAPDWRPGDDFEAINGVGETRAPLGEKLHLTAEPVLITLRTRKP